MMGILCALILAGRASFDEGDADGWARLPRGRGDTICIHRNEVEEIAALGMGDRELGWLRRNRAVGALCGYDGMALALLWRAVMDAQETTEINWNWPAGTGYEEARAWLRSGECGRWVRALGLALGRDLEVCDLAKWAGDPEGRHEEEGS